jgi:hypothetical protein
MTICLTAGRAHAGQMSRRHPRSAQVVACANEWRAGYRQFKNSMSPPERDGILLFTRCEMLGI